ncbi:tRNA (N(6)-L-threonylcarbamoyladenosine(37)-C(2))-methylthiotransferase MtaB [Blattabacterium cuenoti]|uniref:tRNA (N(6)-L-threonylcarbamoyladenosine(37)-C(2))- methylthiotransferase MtaB n=1 Tax=Blattabacterium cuenoti TaxID=1653831 RepID=UPI001EEA6CE6|nr:tRNA (N(6)-L-threonylcarbamoyladenosine(37)-C(2))-methylthiotransferase MtaB [Blattabacterium cuenoti]
MKQKVAFYTIGCKLNYAETSTISRKFSNLYYKHVSFKSYADIYVINSCSVTRNAEIKFRMLVRKAKSMNSKAFIIAIGCYAQLNYKEVSSIMGVSLVLRYEEKSRIIDYISKKKKNITKTEKKKYSYFPSFSIAGDHRSRSFLKIQDGCDYKCNYCVIPRSRGPSRSEKIENILNNIHFLINKGVKEIVFTGINIGDYQEKIYTKSSHTYTFFDLIKMIEDQIKEKVRIRLSSIEPNLLKNELIDFLSKSKCFVPHFHIPLQSGSNTILGSMSRRYNRELYQEKIYRIKQSNPEACIGSDVIVGFPGEKHQHFYETYQFLEKLDLSYLHIFTYSPRPYTKSISMSGHVSKKIKNKRNKVLRILSYKKYRIFCEMQIFTKKTVLFEKSTNNKKYLYGYTENYIRTKILKKLIKPIYYHNTLQNVILTEIDKDGIVIANPFN